MIMNDIHGQQEDYQLGNIYETNIKYDNLMIFCVLTCI